MPKTIITLAVLTAACLLTPGLANAEAAAGDTARETALKAPPVRPMALTAAQYEGLQQVQAEAEHVQVLETVASYSEEREERLKWTRFSDDVWTVVYQVGWPAAYMAVMLCAL